VLHQRPDMSEDFLESFLALKQGGEFGESLLVLAQRLDDEQLSMILRTVGAVREQVKSVSEVYWDVDIEVSQGLEKAILMRTTEILKAAERLAVNGAAYQEVNGADRFTVDSFDQIMLALSYLEKGVNNAAKLGHKDATLLQGGPGVDPWVQQIDSEAPAVLITRRQTVSDRSQIDRNLEQGRWARANMLVNVVDHDLQSYWTLDQRSGKWLSIRIDYKDGRLTVDLGGRSQLESAPDWVVAQVVSAGAIQIARERGEAPADYHVEGAMPHMSEAEFGDFIDRLRGVA